MSAPVGTMVQHHDWQSPLTITISYFLEFFLRTCLRFNRVSAVWARLVACTPEYVLLRLYSPAFPNRDYLSCCPGIFYVDHLDNGDKSFYSPPGKSSMCHPSLFTHFWPSLYITYGLSLYYEFLITSAHHHTRRSIWGSCTHDRVLFSDNSSRNSLFKNIPDIAFYHASHSPGYVKCWGLWWKFTNQCKSIAPRQQARFLTANWQTRTVYRILYQLSTSLTLGLQGNRPWPRYMCRFCFPPNCWKERP